MNRKLRNAQWWQHAITQAYGGLEAYESDDSPKWEKTIFSDIDQAETTEIGIWNTLANAAADPGGS